jgi:hypothetical protein
MLPHRHLMKHDERIQQADRMQALLQEHAWFAEQKRAQWEAWSLGSQQAHPTPLLRYGPVRCPAPLNVTQPCASTSCAVPTLRKVLAS